MKASKVTYISQVAEVRRMRKELNDLIQRYCDDVAFSLNQLEIYRHNQEETRLRNEIMNQEEVLRYAREGFTVEELKEMKAEYKQQFNEEGELYVKGAKVIPFR